MDELMLFDPADGTECPYPSHAGQYRAWHGQVAWLFNPFTGDKRSPQDIGSDCFGYLLCGVNPPLPSDAQSGSLIGAGAILREEPETPSDDSLDTLVRQLLGRAAFLRKKGDQKSHPLMARAASAIQMLAAP